MVIVKFKGGSMRKIKYDAGEEIVLTKLGKKYTTGKPILIWSGEIEDGALEQLIWASNHPCLFHHAAAMPDVHQGYGLPIGGVVAFHDGVSPYCVGKDKGCGMHAIQTNIKWEFVTREQIIQLRRAIRAVVPMGGGKVHDKPQDWIGFDKYLDYFTVKSWRWVRRSLGTLGGGNHFIEIQAGSDGYLWIMIHSGSRKLGDTLCSHHHNIALEHNTRWHTKLPTPYMAFLPTGTTLCDNYIHDMNFALDFAKENRSRMMAAVVKVAQEIIPELRVEVGLDIHHNYAALENHMGKNVWVHRKGATSAKKGEFGIIPGSQGSSSYIVKGLGNPMSFMSCPHGAGRAFGRMDACRNLDPEKEAKLMEGIVYDSPKDTVVKVDGEKTIRKDLAESVGAYKDISVVMKNASDLVEIEVELRPLGNIKGDDDTFKKRKLIKEE